MKQPQDHLPKKPRSSKGKPQSAVQREAETTAGETVTITWRDLEFAIPATFDDLDVEFLEAAENRQAAGFVAAVLGERQYAAFKRTRPKVRDLTEVADLIAEVYGFEGQGE